MRDAYRVEADRHGNDSQLQDYLEEDQFSKDLMYSHKEAIPEIPQQQSSPNKSGTIPMSLAFKRKSIETRENNA